MSTYTTKKGYAVEVNWRNHESKELKDIDYLLERVDAFADQIKPYHPVFDNIAVIFHVTKNKARKIKPAPKEPDVAKKSVVSKVVQLVTGKKTTKKKK